MVRGRRVGGSGWAGLHGSFIGMGGKRVWPAKAKKRKKKIKVKLLHPEFSGYLTLAEARAAGLTSMQWQAQCNQLVACLERDIMATKARLDQLKAELRLAERARQAAFKVPIVNTLDEAPIPISNCSLPGDVRSVEPDMN